MRKRSSATADTEYSNYENALIFGEYMPWLRASYQLKATNPIPPNDKNKPTILVFARGVTIRSHSFRCLSCFPIEP